MTKWNKEQDRALSARAKKTTLFWDSAQKGTYNVGRNAEKRRRLIEGAKHG